MFRNQSDRHPCPIGHRNRVGESTLAKEHNNFFGITAYGRPNAFWKGTKTDLSENSGHTSLWFRTYESAEDSFMDFARLIHTAYPVAASLSTHPSAYAKEIAYSKYISEVNGDNRAAYQRMLVSICRTIERDNSLLSSPFIKYECSVVGSAVREPPLRCQCKPVRL